MSVDMFEIEVRIVAIVGKKEIKVWRGVKMVVIVVL